MRTGEAGGREEERGEWVVTALNITTPSSSSLSSSSASASASSEAVAAASTLRRSLA
jgi:hypothetical protein